MPSGQSHEDIQTLPVGEQQHHRLRRKGHLIVVSWWRTKERCCRIQRHKRVIGLDGVQTGVVYMLEV